MQPRVHKVLLSGCVGARHEAPWVLSAEEHSAYVAPGGCPADKPMLHVTDLWKIETATIMPSKSDAASRKWIEDTCHILTERETTAKKVLAQVEEAGNVLHTLGKWEMEPPRSEEIRATGPAGMSRLDVKETHAKRDKAKRAEKPKMALACDTAQVRAHPLLAGQQGLFATADLRREDIAFSELLPVVSRVPAELKGSDHYIAIHHGAGSIANRRSKHKTVKEMFLVLRMESAAHDSMAYYLNSAGSSSNVLDPNAQGANVMLVVTVGSLVGTHSGSWWLGRPARVTARCLRHVAAGEELLWAYDFEPPPPGSAEAEEDSDTDTPEPPSPSFSTPAPARSSLPRRHGRFCRRGSVGGREGQMSQDPEQRSTGDASLQLTAMVPAGASTASVDILIERSLTERKRFADVLMERSLTEHKRQCLNGGQSVRGKKGFQRKKKNNRWSSAGAPSSRHPCSLLVAPHAPHPRA